jgi:hypothetical protein
LSNLNRNICGTIPRQGTINKSFSLTREAFDLLEQSGVPNQSKFISDLIQDALHDRSYMRRKLISEMSKIQEVLETDCGVSVEFMVKDEQKKGVV